MPFGTAEVSIIKILSTPEINQKLLLKSFLQAEANFYLIYNLVLALPFPLCYWLCIILLKRIGTVQRLERTAMFILRLLFWGLVLLLLLPTSREEKQALYGAATRTAQDVYSFCARNPEVCQHAKSIFHTVVQRVKLGAEMVEDLVNAKLSAPNGEAQPEDASYPQTHSPTQLNPAVYKPQNTLNDEDLRPEWRGPRT